ncbi:MAG: lysophospholipid acyltransferase family protein [Acidobacteriota bacterium]
MTTRRSHFYGAFWYRLHIFAVRRLPAWVIRVLLPFFATLVFVLGGSMRRAIARNLDAALGRVGPWRRWRRVWRNMTTWAWCATERYESLSGHRPVICEVPEGLETWREILDRGDGFILATAHLGHWESGSLFPAGEHGRRVVHVVREEEMEPEAQRVFEEFLSQTDDTTYKVHFAHRNPTLGQKLLVALRRGEVVALQADRPATGGRSIEVELFGRPFAVPIGPMMMARAAGAPILPAFLYRVGRSRAMPVFRPPIWVEPTDDREGDLRRAAQALVAEVEAAILRDPMQWFCVRDLWPKEEAA